ncbi:MAG: hypothetical protein WA637_18095 [Terriglobales bacterium]
MLRRRAFSRHIPHPIEPDWDPLYAPRLAEFPVNICHASPRDLLLRAKNKVILDFGVDASPAINRSYGAGALVGLPATLTK